MPATHWCDNHKLAHCIMYIHAKFDAFSNRMVQVGLDYQINLRNSMFSVPFIWYVHAHLSNARHGTLWLVRMLSSFNSFCRINPRYIPCVFGPFVSIVAFFPLQLCRVWYLWDFKSYLWYLVWSKLRWLKLHCLNTYYIYACYGAYVVCKRIFGFSFVANSIALWSFYAKCDPTRSIVVDLDYDYPSFE